MPPIRGVANAAMVLQDKPFDNMTWEDFEKVLSPKVEGSLNLDELLHSVNADFFRKHGIMALSETDFHDLLTDAIVTGQAGAHQELEIITGIGQDTKASWHVQPQFYAYVNRGTRVREKRQQKASGDINADKINKQSPLMDLGIDSQVAVQVHTWFLEELSVDIPVLRILGGASVMDLRKDAFARLHIESDTGRDESGAAEPPVAQTPTVNNHWYETLTSHTETVGTTKRSVPTQAKTSRNWLKGLKAPSTLSPLSQQESSKGLTGLRV
ncbi:hypothetical protein DL762_008636 [Monosporascus cannonballus]|uniref:Carrier domain-containing protein n=1 Tax=Monosporascus cannonballus TaxID=155416 RepID=A0ABY0GYX6_9PEZI|nr:hypothetical protein DL762_008636 [Monosporascus cannonballus]